jgi:hypothetical protein
LFYLLSTGRHFGQFFYSVYQMKNAPTTGQPHQASHPALEHSSAGGQSFCQSSITNNPKEPDVSI